MESCTIQGLVLNNVYSDIMAFLNQYESKNTRKEYRRDIQEFFHFICGKELESLLPEDVISRKGTRLSKKCVIEYRNYLNSKGNSKGTRNRKMSATRNLYKFLQSEGYDIDHMIFALKPLKYIPDSYESLTKEEVMTLADYLKKQRYGDELYAFVYLAVITSFRVDAILNIDKKKDIRKDKNSEFYLVTAVDKRNQKRSMPIELWLFELLDNLNGDTRLFENLTVDIIHDAITKAAKALEFEGRVVTHSLRKVAPTFGQENGNSVKSDMEQTGHASVQTFMSTYVKEKINYEDLAGIQMFRTIDETVFDDLSKEQVLSLLKSLNQNVYNQLARHLMRDDKKVV
ncbi:site-specific integrase [Paenibacillus sp. NAIST15-1]|uniref:tyrosine-type recombinase/integrase n=1 Tax=Paenibacillus sp. NAIST15-1 TaxID=1605994 RepID=UPI00086CD3D7|nr:site-specific integrase [Paenibacillus sp. NAIST15-1]GAV11304.1 hypothetical protein PBN151_1231 [Paenibacillus sp. NAIST15-1]